MVSEVQEKIKSMSAVNLAEVAEMVLPDLLGIEDAEGASTRVAALAGLSAEEAKELERLAEASAAQSQSEVTNVLRIVIADLAAGQAEDKQELDRKLTSAGHKQVVVGPELFYFGALLIAGYVAYVKKGKIREKKKVTYEEQKDGRWKLTIDEELVNLNPLNPLSGLIERVLGGRHGKE